MVPIGPASVFLGNKKVAFDLEERVDYFFLMNSAADHLVFDHCLSFRVVGRGYGISGHLSFLFSIADFRFGTSGEDQSNNHYEELKSLHVKTLTCGMGFWIEKLKLFQRLLFFLFSF